MDDYDCTFVYDHWRGASFPKGRPQFVCQWVLSMVRCGVLKKYWVSGFTRIFGRISYCSTGGNLQNIYKPHISKTVLNNVGVLSHDLKRARTRNVVNCWVMTRVLSELILMVYVSFCYME